MRFHFLLVFAIVFCTCQIGYAQEKNPWWKPFGGGAEAGAEAPVRSSSYFNSSKSNKSKFKLPSLGNLFSKKDSSAASSSDDVQFAGATSAGKSNSSNLKGTAKGLTGFANATGNMVEKSGQGMSRNWQRLTNTSKRAWMSTTDFLNPFNDGKKKQSSMPKNMGYQPQHIQPKKPGMFDWLIPPPSEPEPSTVGDFLRMDRPSY